MDIRFYGCLSCKSIFCLEYNFVNLFYIFRTIILCYNLYDFEFMCLTNHIKVTLLREWYDVMLLGVWKKQKYKMVCVYMNYDKIAYENVL